MIINESDLILAALDEVDRARQMYPEWPSDIVHATAIIVEESGEVLKEANNLRWNQGGDIAALRKELIQTVAMCMRFAEETDPSRPCGDGFK